MTDQNVQKIVVVQSTKNVGVAVILALFFGPLGLLYSSVMAAVIMFFVTLVIGLITLGFGLLLTNPICAVWGGLAASSHNKKLMEGHVV